MGFIDLGKSDIKGHVWVTVAVEAVQIQVMFLHNNGGVSSVNVQKYKKAQEHSCITILIKNSIVLFTITLVACIYFQSQRKYQ